MRALRLALLGSTVLAQPAFAQDRICTIPAQLRPPKVEVAPPGKRRIVPVAGYTLALSWSPHHCRRGRDPVQCGTRNRFGFILHGLWPEAADARFPAWCRPVAALPTALIRRHLCMTPSVQLLQHGWAKHGSCAADDPARYFTAAATLYRAVVMPDMAALSRRRVTVADVATAFATANRLPPGRLGVFATRDGWLTEVRLCLDARLRTRPCPGYARGRSPDTVIKIWRGDSRG